MRAQISQRQLVSPTLIGPAKSEAEIAERVSRFIKAELKRADITYEELAKRLKQHGLPG